MKISSTMALFHHIERWTARIIRHRWNAWVHFCSTAKNLEYAKLRETYSNLAEEQDVVEVMHLSEVKKYEENMQDLKTMVRIFNGKIGHYRIICFLDTCLSANLQLCLSLYII